MTLSEFIDHFHEELDGRVIQINDANDAVRITFECDHWELVDLRRAFTVGCYRAIWLKAYHPLLWDHNSPQGELYFMSTPDNADEVAGVLYETHRRLSGVAQLVRLC